MQCTRSHRHADIQQLEKNKNQPKQLHLLFNFTLNNLHNFISVCIQFSAGKTVKDYIRVSIKEISRRDHKTWPANYTARICDIVLVFIFNFPASGWWLSNIKNMKSALMQLLFLKQFTWSIETDKCVNIQQPRKK